MISNNETRKGLVILYTGDGKGKTTAALGLLLRAWGQKLSVGMFQFIKQANGNLGEVKAARQLGIEWHGLGAGFTWRAGNEQRNIERAREAWGLVQTKIASGGYDLILLDEFTYPLQFGWLDVADVITWLRQHRPPALHLVVTGRDAPPLLVHYADLVTEMQNVKHPFNQGVPAQPGIEF